MIIYNNNNDNNNNNNNNNNSTNKHLWGEPTHPQGVLWAGLAFCVNFINKLNVVNHDEIAD